jgi:hypothetical protein
MAHPDFQQLKVCNFYRNIKMIVRLQIADLLFHDLIPATWQVL